MEIWLLRSIQHARHRGPHRCVAASRPCHAMDGGWLAASHGAVAWCRDEPGLEFGRERAEGTSRGIGLIPCAKAYCKSGRSPHTPAHRHRGQRRPRVDSTGAQPTPHGLIAASPADAMRILPATPWTTSTWRCQPSSCIKKPKYSPAPNDTTSPPPVRRRGRLPPPGSSSPRRGSSPGRCSSTRAVRRARAGSGSRREP